MTFWDTDGFDTALCGIDEAGRGPLAGPLVMAGVILGEPIEGLGDSKKLTAKKRDELFELIIANAVYHIAVIEADEIDRHGISPALSKGLREITTALDAQRYLFDGNCKFGVEGITTLVKADAIVAQVSAASILAKVTRDRMMDEYALLYPQYLFEKHKGYGTKAHTEAIRLHGYSPIHRRSYRLKGLETEQVPSIF